MLNSIFKHKSNKDYLIVAIFSVIFAIFNSFGLIFKESVDEILKGIKKVFELTPPELAADIFDKGIYLTGGGSQLYGLDAAIKEEIGVDCLRVDDPMRAVILGIQKRIMMFDRQEEND